MKNIVIAKPVKAQVWVNMATQIPADVLLVMEEVTLYLRKMKMSEEFYEENDSRMNIIGQNGNDGLHYAKVDKKQLTHREACEKICLLYTSDAADE